MLEAEARRLGAELCWVEPLAAAEAGGPTLGLSGVVQRSNGAVAVAMARALSERAWPRPEVPLSEAAILAGLASARWPGRLETRHFRGVPLLLDGAHNPPAAVVLRRELDRLGTGARLWMIGIQRHKDGASVLRALLGPEDRALIVPIPNHRAWSLDALAAACPDLAGQLASLPDLEAGLQQLITSGASDTRLGRAVPVVAGSLYLLGAVIPLLDPLQTPPALRPAPQVRGVGS